MMSRSLGSGSLGDEHGTGTSSSIGRAILVAAITLVLFFIIVGLLTSLSGCSPTQASSGIKGVVTIGPTQPVATQGTASDSKPYSAKLMITEQGGQHLKRPARVKSGTDGTFSVALEPGTYVIEADGRQSPPTLTPLTVKVVAGRYTTVEVPFDSGIR